MNPNMRRRWLSALTAVGALAYGWVGFNAQGLERPAGLAGAAAVLAALAVAGFRTGRPAALVAAALLVLGVLPLAMLTWWSVVTPLLAVLILVLGGARVRAARQGAGRPAR